MATATYDDATCCVCGAPLTGEEITFWLNVDGGDEFLADNDVDCFDCQAADHASECAALAYAESGGGSEMVNDLRAERTYGGY